MEMGALAAVDAVLGIFAVVLIATASTGFSFMALGFVALWLYPPSKNIAGTAAEVGASVCALSLLLLILVLIAKLKVPP